MESATHAWAAGFLDGEGCIRAYRKTNQYALQVTAWNKDIRPLEKLKDVYGGSVGSHSNGCWRWQVSANIALSFLKHVRPFLVVKGEQADVAISFQERRYASSPELDEKDAQALKDLKHVYPSN